MKHFKKNTFGAQEWSCKHAGCSDRPLGSGRDCQCTWVTVQGRVMLAVAACESSGAAAHVQAGIRVLAHSSILNNDMEAVSCLLWNLTKTNML